MSFSTNFQPIFHCTGDNHYDNIYTSYPEPPQDRARAEIARLKRSLIVPEFADHTPLDLFNRDRILVEAAPHWSWESETLGARGHLPSGTGGSGVFFH